MPDARVTCDDAVKALKAINTSVGAKAIAAHLGTSSRAVATALRQATEDGRVSMRFKGGLALYRFKRMRAGR